MGFFNTIMNNTGVNNTVISSSNGMSTITVNGKTTKVKGSNINVVNGKIYVDGKLYKDDENFKEDYVIQSVTINGNVGNISCGGSVTVNGNVSGKIDCGGSVKVEGECSGGIDCGGSVKVGTFVRR